MRNPDFDPSYWISKDKLKRSIRFKAVKRRILAKIDKVKYSLGLQRINLRIIPSKPKLRFKPQLDWGLLLKILIAAIIVILVGFALAFNSIKQDTEQELQDKTKQLEQNDNRLKELDNQQKKLQDELDNQKKELEKTKKLIQLKKQRQAQYAAIYSYRPIIVSNPTVETYLLSKFSPSGSYNARVMLAVCKSESGLRSVDNGVGDMGVCQIRLSVHWDKVPGITYEEKKASLLNPYINVDLAWQISNHGTNFWPWTDYKTGKYLNYL